MGVTPPLVNTPPLGIPVSKIPRYSCPEGSHKLHYYILKSGEQEKCITDSPKFCEIYIDSTGTCEQCVKNYN